MTQVTHELDRTVIADRGQTYSFDRAAGVLRVKIEGRSGRVQWRTIKDKRRIKTVLTRAALPLADTLIPARSKRREFSVRMWDAGTPLGGETYETITAKDAADAELTASLEYPQFDHYEASE